MVSVSRVTCVSGSLKRDVAPVGVLCGEIDTGVSSKVTALMDDTGCTVTGVVAVIVTAVSVRI